MSSRDISVLHVGTEALKPFRKRTITTGANIDRINRSLVDSYQKGNGHALDELSRLNEGLVYRGVTMIRPHGVHKEDLVQEGFLGLMTAATKFDRAYKNAFTTYAMWWIRATAQRFVLNTMSDIRVPIHTREKFLRILDILEKDTLSVGRNGFLSAAQKARISKSEAVRIYEGFLDLQATVSLDAPFLGWDANVDSLGDILVDTSAVNQVTHLCATEEANSIVRDFETVLCRVRCTGTISRYRAFAVHYFQTDGTGLHTAETYAKRVKQRADQIRKAALAAWDSVPKTFRIHCAATLHEEIERLTDLLEYGGIPIDEVLRRVVDSCSV